MQSSSSELLAISSVLVNQQCILNKVPLNRNTPKTRLYAVWLTKVGPEAVMILTLCFP